MTTSRLKIVNFRVMSKAVIILIFSAVLTIGIGTKTAFCIPPQIQSADHTKVRTGIIHTGIETFMLLLGELTPLSSSETGPLEGEPEDDDNTSRISKKTTSSYFSRILSLRFAHQNALFKELHLEKETPPPQH